MDFYYQFFLSLGYEFSVAYDYSKKTGAKLYLVDHLKIDEMDLSIKIIGPTKLDPSEPRKNYDRLIDEIYFGRADESALWDLLGFSVSSKITSDAKFMEERESYMADRILRLRPHLHIGGVDHIFPSSGTDVVTPLFNRLGDVVTNRIRLCEEIPI